jgi:hypothetical protein
MTTDQVDEFPAICITPLYHFASDCPELIIAKGIRIVSFDRYDGPAFDEIVKKYLDMFEPQYLLMHDPVLSGDVYIDDILDLFAKKDTVGFATLLVHGTSKLFALLRLFKPGRLRAGETFVVSRLLDAETESWHATSHYRLANPPYSAQGHHAQVLLTGDLRLLRIGRNRQLLSSRPRRLLGGWNSD